MSVRKPTERQQIFARHYATSGNASEAYRLAYPKSLKWKAETVYSESSRLLKNPQVSTRVDELKAEIAKKWLWGREDSVKTLVNLIQRTKKVEGEGGEEEEIQVAQDKDVIAAVKELNSMHGYNEPTKIQHTDAEGKPMGVFQVEFVSAKN